MVQDLIDKSSIRGYHYTQEEAQILLNQDSLCYPAVEICAKLPEQDVLQYRDTDVLLVIAAAGIGSLAYPFREIRPCVCFEPDPKKVEIGRTLNPAVSFIGRDIRHFWPPFDADKTILLCAPPVGTSSYFRAREEGFQTLHYSGQQIAYRWIDAITQKVPEGVKKYFLLPYNLAHYKPSLAKFRRETRILLHSVAVLEDYELMEAIREY